jgi:hypothetical protein
MRYPILNELDTTREMTDAFGGYNHNLRIGVGEFFDMKNLTSTYYPVLSPRGKRGIYKEAIEPLGIISKNKLCHVDNGIFYIDNIPVEGIALSHEPKRMVSMGANVIILPDRKYVNTEDPTDCGDIDYEYVSEGNVTFTLAKLDGSDYTLQYTQAEEPTGAIANMALWLDTSTTPHTLKQYSATSGIWVQIATTYIRIEATGIGKHFNQYDGVNISGLKDSEITNGVGDPVNNTTQDELAEIDGSMTIWERQDDYIVVVGLLSQKATVSNRITISRRMPAMDFVIESGNRLWGCRYGIANNGEFVNEIYASKLGDFKNWQSFMGVSTDSYTVGVGSDGAFTGAITYLGHPLFFKETCLHKIYGDALPFGVQNTACRGVQSGSADSLAIVNEILYYKARSAVCAYDGSLPIEISAPLGEVVYSEASAGVCGNKYYISMRDSADRWNLFAYDTTKNMWHREDELHAKGFCSHRGELYFIDLADNKIKSVLGSGTPEEGEIEWMAETGIMGTDMPDKKYVSRVLLRLMLSIRSTVHIFVQYDSVGEWEYVTMVTGTVLKTFSVPIKPRRCDHFRLRFVGKGDAKLYSITKTIEQGSDI